MSVTLQARITTPQGKDVISNPIFLEILEPRPWRLMAFPGPWQTGLELTLGHFDESDRIITRRVIKRLDHKIHEPGKTPELVLLTGQFQTRQRGFYQLAIRTCGSLEVWVDEQHFKREAPEKDFGMIYLPLFLERGWHRLEIRLSPDGRKSFQALLGGRELPVVLGGNRLRYRKHIGSLEQGKKR